MLRNARADLSGAVSALLVMPLLALVKVAKDAEVRAATPRALSALAEACRQGAVALAPHALKAVAILSGSEGKVAGVPQRSALYSAVSSLAPGFPGEEDGTAASAMKVVEAVCALNKSENNEDLRTALLHSLDKWVRTALSAGDPLPTAVLTILTASVKEAKEGPRRAGVRALTRAICSSEAVRAQISAPITSSLCALAKTGSSKPSQRVEGVLCLAAVAALQNSAACTKAIADVISKEKIWTAALTAESLVVATATASRLDEEDAITLAGVTEALLTKQHKLLKKSAGDDLGVCRVLLLLLAHPRHRVRAAAEQAAQGALASNPGLVQSLFTAFKFWVESDHERRRVFVASDASPSGSVSSSAAAGEENGGIPPRRLAAALCSISTSAYSSDPMAFGSWVCELMVLSHHRSTAVSERRPHSLWRSLSRGFDKIRLVEGDLPPVAQVLECDATEGVVSTLLGETIGIASESTSLASAALLAVAEGASIASGLASSLCRTLLSGSNLAAHDSLTPQQLKIWRTPPGRLSSDPDPRKQAEIANRNKKAKKKAGKPRGPFNVDYDSEDDSSEDEAPAKKAPPPSTSASKKLDPKELKRQQDLATEAATRGEVETLRIQLVRTLRGLGALAKAEAAVQRASSIDTLREVGVLVHALLASDIVGEEAAASAMEIARACGATVQARAGRIVCALRAVTRGKAVSLDVDVADAVNAVCETIDADVQQGLPAYEIAFPVIRYALLSGDASVARAALRATTSLVLSEKTEDIISPLLPNIPPLVYGALEIRAAFEYSKWPVEVPVQAVDLLRRCCAGLSSPVHVMTALQGVVSQFASVRGACLHSLSQLDPGLLAVSEDETEAASLMQCEISARLYLACHDPESEQNAESADDVLSSSERVLPPGYAEILLSYMSPLFAPTIREAAALAIADAMDEFADTAQTTLSHLFSHFGKCVLAEGRCGVARTLLHAARDLNPRTLPLIPAFLIRGLGDSDELVRAEVVAAGKAVVDAHGEEHTALLLPVFESYLERATQSAGNETSEQNQDQVRGGVVVILGALAKHLPATDEKRGAILTRLITVLATPSEEVQRGVADALPALVPALGEAERSALVADLLETLIKSESFGKRRGAAFGLAGVVKGLGVGSVKTFGIMEALKTAIEDKKSSVARDGALQGFECLCERLGRLFEPYVIHILPVLLVCFGDSNPLVREATAGAARAMMGQLSGQGVKLVLPALLKGLEDTAWRTKQGSVQLLGAMAHCQPKQLGSCLPTIVPKLSESLADTHPKVQASAQEALQMVGGVIRNPEIQALVPTLLDALSNPTERTPTCMDTLLETTFVNSVDAPSLALIVPVLLRALRERTTELKKKASKIAGNMCALVSDPKDMGAYIPLLLPELKKALIDPIPEVRTISAQALASLLSGMGEEHFEDFLPWLLQMLQSEASAVERSGAARGLAEALAVLGSAHVESLMPDILKGCRHSKAVVRDGHLTLVQFLPSTLDILFEHYVPEALPCILDGLADEAEGVREAALAAGREFINQYTFTALPLLLPGLEDGVLSDNWRIRQSSLELQGDLLFKITGLSGKIQTSEVDEDGEGLSSEAQGQTLVEALGDTKRSEVLAGVYFSRSDVALSVRNVALHIWKTVVPNSPKMLTHVLPQLMQRVIACLASSSEDARHSASRCLGELVRKLGDRVLHNIVPILQGGLQPDKAEATRQGVMLGLSEILTCAPRSQLQEYFQEVIPTVRIALCDSSEDVREAAGRAFSMLLKGAGPEAAAEIVPALLEALETDPNALEGLKEVLKTQPRILASVLPKLVVKPLGAFRARTLGQLAAVAGPGLPPHLTLILPPLIAEVSLEGDAEDLEAASAALQAVCYAAGEDGAGVVIAEFLRALEPTAEPALQRAAAKAVSAFVVEVHPTQLIDLDPHLSLLLSALIGLFNSADAAVLRAAWESTQAVVGAIPKVDLPDYVHCLRDAVATAREKERRKHRGQREITVPGFCLPKGLLPVVSIYLQGVLTGNAEARELAAEALGELVEVTNTDALKPQVVTITGPLIRTISDKFPWQTRASILSTLGIIINKGQLGVKAFVPQLQTTFLKCLHDEARQVRKNAAGALGSLMTLQPRVDAVATDLLNSLMTTQGGTRVAMAQALRGLMQQAGSKVSAPVLERAARELIELFAEDDEELATYAARALAQTGHHCPDGALDELVRELTYAGAGLSPEEHALRGLALSGLCQVAAARVLAEHARRDSVVGALTRNAAATTERPPVRARAARGLAALATAECTAVAGGEPSVLLSPTLAPALSKLLTDTANEVRVAALAALKGVATAAAAAGEASVALLDAALPELLPPILTALGDRHAAAKTMAHRTGKALLRPPGSGAALPPAPVPAALRAKVTPTLLTKLADFYDEQADDAEEEGGA